MVCVKIVWKVKIKVSNNFLNSCFFIKGIKATKTRLNTKMVNAFFKLHFAANWIFCFLDIHEQDRQFTFGFSKSSLLSHAVCHPQKIWPVYYGCCSPCNSRLIFQCFISHRANLIFTMARKQPYFVSNHAAFSSWLYFELILSFPKRRPVLDL